MRHESPSAGDRAHASLRSDILAGRLPVGTMLSEAVVAAALGMSRTPVRAALLRLQEEGWVTIYPQRGALVTEIPARRLREASEARNALETAGVRRASAPARARLADVLPGELDEQRRALDVGDFDAFTASAMRFHRSFAAAHENDLLLGWYDRLQDLQHLSITRRSVRITSDPTEVLVQHGELLRCAVAGDHLRFAAALDAHQAEDTGV